MPVKTDTPLLVNADTVLPCPVSFELFQAICRWDTQIIQGHSAVQHPELAQGDLLDIVWQLPGALSEKDLFSFFAFE